jgi:hypothetical protein
LPQLAATPDRTPNFREISGFVAGATFRSNRHQSQLHRRRLTPLGFTRKDAQLATYLVVYKGGGPMPETAEAQAASMNAWMSWFGGLGDSVIDSGNPFSVSAAIAANGSVTQGASSALTGYSLLSADSLAAATEMAKGCPILAADGSVDVYEAFNVM